MSPSAPQIDRPDLRQRVDAIRQKIEESCNRAGRDPNDVKLVTVSKRHPAEAIRQAYGCGLRDFGENYAQELASKAAALADLKDLRWHFIGPLQSNKAALVLPHLQLIHSVHSGKLIARLDRLADSPIRILLQLNVAEEPTKSGAKEIDLEELLEVTARATNIDCVGLMTIPPADDDVESARGIFRRLRALRDLHAARYPLLQDLSMGMTSDLEVAVEEGATIVRIGTAIFGARPT